MKITIESTTEIIALNGKRARAWNGKTEKGINVVCYIAAIKVLSKDDTSQFEKELKEIEAPQINK